MTIRVAINGFGRIGRSILRAYYERKLDSDITVVAINDLSPIDLMAHLCQFDTVHGRMAQHVSHDSQSLIIDRHAIPVLKERDPSKLPWDKLNVDVVLECTGLFTSRQQAAWHVQAGAKKVLISAPAKDQVDATIVFGVNHQHLDPHAKVISNASCTTNCLAPIVQILHQSVGFRQGTMLTVHASTNDQVITDVAHPDWCRARSSLVNIIPTKTGAAKAIGMVMPELAGKIDGMAVRIPTVNVSLVYLTADLEKPIDQDSLHKLFRVASTDSHQGIMAVNDLPLVSSDFNHHAASCIVDLTQTKQVGSLWQILGWYDNEWGFANRMLDSAAWCVSQKKLPR